MKLNRLIIIYFAKLTLEREADSSLCNYIRHSLSLCISSHSGISSRLFLLSLRVFSTASIEWRKHWNISRDVCVKFRKKGDEGRGI